ncbi:unnamed protein product [Prorocentrum cordatum]|uniref:Uncharacterized protein n=1 Tax=Prorocentrum cordatum TaxID=2364126 RepID=A0ABN9QRM7_9DINO|nr:unnamed protein product [Polarella glacialis]
MEALRALGGPTASRTVTLLETLAGLDIGKALRQQITDYLAKVEPPDGAEAVVSRETLGLEIQAIKIESPYDEKKAKLMLAAPHWLMRGVITHAFTAEGLATRMTGIAPRVARGRALDVAGRSDPIELVHGETLNATVDPARPRLPSSDSSALSLSPRSAVLTLFILFPRTRLKNGRGTSGCIVSAILFFCGRKRGRSSFFFGPQPGP